MPLLPLQRKREQAARKFILPAVSLVHLSLFLIARRATGWADWAVFYAASAAAVLASIQFRDFFTDRKRDRLPDVPAMLAWGGAALLEFGALFPALSDTRIVPAVLFPSFAFLLPAGAAAVYAAVAVAWLLFSPDGDWPAAVRTASIAGLGGLGWIAGRMARGKLEGSASGSEMMEEAIHESRLLVLPWEDPEGEAGKAAPAAIERMGLLRSREELMDGVRRILEGVLPVIGADRILYLFPSGAGPGRSFRIGASASRGGDPGTDGGELAIPDHYAPIREAMMFRRTFLAEGEDAGKWPIPHGGKKVACPTGVAAAPVCIEENTAGAVLALRFGEGGWNEPVGQVLEMAAFLTAREISRAKRQYRVNLYLADQEGFHRLVRRIAEISEKRESEEKGSVSVRREVYRVTVEQARKHLDVGRVLFVEAEEGGKRGRIGWESGETSSGEREGWVPLEGTYVEWVLKQGVHRMFSGEQASSGRFPVLPQEWAGGAGKGYLLVPVPDPGGFQGVLACEAAEERRFEGEDAEAVKDILTIMRMGISHALWLESLEREAKNDGLTGLLNRKTFHDRLTNVLSRLDGRYPCAVIMLDLDHFKRINDTYGHPAGDEVLRKVSSVIGKTVRKVDMAGRYGGEEFALYLHSIDQVHAVQIAERLRLIIRQTRFVFGKKEVSVTASLGIACHPAHGLTGEDLLRHADEALYRSKQGGRDRTTVFLKQ
ncbi:MAG: sensor domain-containing diguanylate cyclase [Deltaproteobacteria bacterium]|nr:sensor domain-containing diguanylate cyclase [Deltaproteobacteria bacterium]